MNNEWKAFRRRDTIERNNMKGEQQEKREIFWKLKKLQLVWSLPPPEIVLDRHKDRRLECCQAGPCTSAHTLTRVPARPGQWKKPFTLGFPICQ
jgi:hypothetical protein